MPVTTLPIPSLRLREDPEGLSRGAATTAPERDAAEPEERERGEPLRAAVLRRETAAAARRFLRLRGGVARGAARGTSAHAAARARAARSRRAAAGTDPGRTAGTHRRAARSGPAAANTRGRRSASC